MNIDTNSWHFQMLKAMDKRPGVAYYTLCQYVRGVIFALMQLVFIAACLLSALGAVVYGLVISTWDLLTFTYAAVGHMLGFANFHDLYTSEFEGTYLPSEGGVILVVLLIGAVWYGFKVASRKYEEHLERKFANKLPYPPRAPNIFVRWVSDLHSRTCSTITYVTRHQPDVSKEKVNDD